MKMSNGFAKLGNLFVIIVSVACIGYAQPQKEISGKISPKCVIQRLFKEGMNKGNIQVVRELIAGECKHCEGGYDFSSQNAIIEELENVKRDFVKYEFIVNDIITEKEKVAFRLIFKGQHPKLKYEIIQNSIVMAIIKDGKIRKAWMETDKTSPQSQGQKIRSEIKINPLILDDYTGDYKLSHKFIMSITKENNRLFAQATGQSKVEIYPEAVDSFFYKVIDAQITFVKNKNEKVKQLIIHQNEHDLKLKKIK